MLPADCALASSVSAAEQIQAAIPAALIIRLQFFTCRLLSRCLDIFYEHQCIPWNQSALCPWGCVVLHSLRPAMKVNGVLYYVVILNTSMTVSIFRAPVLRSNSSCKKLTRDLLRFRLHRTCR